MMVASLHDTAWAVYRRRETVWTDRIAKEWSPEKRGMLESRELADLTVWDDVIDFVSPARTVPADLDRCAQSARELLDRLRATTAYDAPIEDQQRFAAIRLLTLHLEDAASLAHREEDRRVRCHRKNSERKAA